MAQHLAAPNHPVPCCESPHQQVSRAIRVLNRTIFHHTLLVPDLIRDSWRAGVAGIFHYWSET